MKPPSELQVVTASVEILAPDSTALSHPVAEISAINSYHHRATGAAEQARQKAEEASHFALLAGTLLEDLHAATPHGDWGKLFTGREGRALTSNPAQIAECAGFDFSTDTARRYIEVAKRIRQEQSLSGKAQKTLAAIASAPEIDEAGREFLNKLTKGQSLRQLYLELDIITAAPKPPKPEKEQPAVPFIPKGETQLRLEDARESWFLWREAAEKLVRNGVLDDLDTPGLQEMKEFQGWLRDRINARLK